MFLSGNNLQLLSILTGVTILEKGEDVRVAFSCYPQERDLGGVGLIKMSRNRTNKEIVKVSITDSDTRVLAGSLFHVNIVSATCSFDPQPHICLPHEPTEVNFPDPTTPVAEPEDNDVDGNKVPRDESNSEENEVEGSDSDDTKPVSGNYAATKLMSPLTSVLLLGSLLGVKNHFSFLSRL